MDFEKDILEGQNFNIVESNVISNRLNETDKRVVIRLMEKGREAFLKESSSTVTISSPWTNGDVMCTSRSYAEDAYEKNKVSIKT